MDLVGTKIVVLTLLGAIRLACGLLPLKITKRLQLWGEQPGSSHRLVQRRRSQVDRAISLCLCFGGGVLLATCFIHMLPEARESLEAARRAGASLVADDQFPFAELFICVGFFLVYIIEEVAHRVFLHHGGGPAAGDAAAASAAPGSAPAKSSAPSGDKSAIAHAVTVPMPVAPAPAAQCCATVESELQRIEAVPVANGDGAGDPERGPPPWSRPRSTGKIAPATSQVHLLASTLSLEQKEPAPGAVVSTMHHHHYHHHHSHGHHHHHHHHHHSVPTNPESSVMGHLRSMLVVLALSFHSVFEGLAIGLQPTPRDVWYLFTAVSIHASAILFCVGLELVMSGMRLLTMLAYLSVLALVSPLGVVLGIVVTSAGSGDDGGGASVGQTLAVGILQGVAGGTILYITFFEVLEREKKRADSAGLLRLACVLAGFAVMVALQLVGGHQHGEEGDHHVTQAAANASTTEASHAHS